MKLRDLKISKDVLSNNKLKGQERFIYLYGLFNCRILRFKDANTVIRIMNEYDPNCLTKEEKKFILKNSGKDVICYVCHTYQDHPDIFVYGDDHIAFQVECFV